MLFITAGMGGGTGHGRRTGSGAGRQGARHPDRRRRHQALRDGGQQALVRGRSRHRRAGQVLRLADHHSQPEAADGARAADNAARCLQVGQPGAAGRGAGHRRADHPARPDQRRLRRRAYRHGRDRHGDDGLGRRQRRRTSAGGGGSGRVLASSGGYQPGRALMAFWSTSPRAWTCPSASSRKWARSSSSSPPRMRRSWSEPSSIRSCRTWSASLWWRPASAGPQRRCVRRPRSIARARPPASRCSGYRDSLTGRAEPAMRVVRRGPLSNSDYAALDKPTVQRQRAVGDGLRPDNEAEDLLDIPAFLRRQAD